MQDTDQHLNGSALVNKEPVFINDIGTLDEDAELLFVRNTRLEVIRQSMPNGRVPSDPEQAEILIKALKDMDQSALTRKKIKSDEKNMDSLSNAAALVAEALKSVNGKTGLADPVQQVARKVEELPEHLRKTDFIEGQLDQGTVTETYDTFTKRMNT